jgi:allantoin racemase
VVCAVKIAEAIVELGKTTSKYKTYRYPEGKAFVGVFEKFGWSDREHKLK